MKIYLLLLLSISNIGYSQTTFHYQTSRKLIYYPSKNSNQANNYEINSGDKLADRYFLKNNKFLTDIRLSLGSGIGFSYGTKYINLNLQSLISKNITGAIGLDYYFIKDKEERKLNNFFSPTLLMSYNIGTDIAGDEITIGGGVSFPNLKELKGLISFKGNLYLKNSWYLGLEVRQTFLEPAAGAFGLIVSPYVGVNVFYRIKN